MKTSLIVAWAATIVGSLMLILNPVIVKILYKSDDRSVQQMPKAFMHILVAVVSALILTIGLTTVMRG